MKRQAWFGIAVGVMILMQWTFFILNAMVPEFETEPRAIAFHIAAETILALALIAGGLAVLKRLPWGPKLLVAAYGMLAYSVINSSGYFAEQNQWIFVVMFFALLAMAVTAVRSMRFSLESAQ